MGDLTAVEHVQRQIRTNRKPRTALLAEVFGRGGYSSTVRRGSHQQPVLSVRPGTRRSSGGYSLANRRLYSCNFH